MPKREEDSGTYNSRDLVECIDRCLESKQAESVATGITKRSIRIIEVAPCPGAGIWVLDETEHLKIVDERAIGKDDVHIKGKPLEDLHFRDHERFFEVVEGLVKVEHGAVDKGAGAIVSGPLEQHVVHVDEITHAQGGFLKLGREEEGTHADVLVKSEQGREEKENKDLPRRQSASSS